jgi:hypothetical protein
MFENSQDHRPGQPVRRSAGVSSGKATRERLEMGPMWKGKGDFEPRGHFGVRLD